MDCDCAGTPTTSPTTQPTESPTIHFGDISFNTTSFENFSTTSMEIGWIKYSSCTEGNNEQNYNPDYSLSGLIHLAKYAVTVKFLPSTDVLGVNETANYSIMADLCSNPIYALNNGYSMSWTVDEVNGSMIITNLSDTDNWIGVNDAKLMKNYGTGGYDEIGQEPSTLQSGHLYHASGNGDGLHVFQYDNGTALLTTKCWWNTNTYTGHDITVYLGFDVDQTHHCYLENGTYKFMTLEPTTDPTMQPTPDPTYNPSETPTSDPTATPTVSDSMFLGDSPMTWSEANSYCNASGRELLSIHNNATNSEARALCATFNHTAVSSYGCWLGLYDNGTHDYIWTDGSESNYGFDDDGTATTGVYPWSDWGSVCLEIVVNFDYDVFIQTVMQFVSNQGNPSSTSEDCIQMRIITYKWNDVSCSEANVPICKGIRYTFERRDKESIFDIFECFCFLCIVVCDCAGAPTTSPTYQPTTNPSTDPSANPTLEPTKSPTYDPSQSPTTDPTSSPTMDPTFDPTTDPTTGDFQILFHNSLSADEWTNEGTLGSNYSMTNLTGTVQSVKTNAVGGYVDALCFNESSNLTYINYDINPSVNPQLTMEVWIQPTSYGFLGTHWILGHDDGDYDRGIAVNDYRYNGLAVGVGSEYTSTLGIPSLDEWIHVVAIWSDTLGMARVFLNGGTLNNGTQQTINGTAGESTKNRVSVNGLQAYTDHRFYGCFARIQITNRVVDLATIAEMYSEFDSVMNTGL